MNEEIGADLDFGIMGPIKLDTIEQQRTRQKPPLRFQEGHLISDENKRQMLNAPSSMRANMLGAGVDDRGMDPETLDRHAELFEQGMFSQDDELRGTGRYI